MSPTSKTKAASPGKAATASAKATTEKTGTASTKKAGAAASGQDGPAGGGYAIVEASGQQFWLQPNRYYDLDRLAVDVDGTLTIDNVLLVNDGKATTLGQPYVKGASVALKVMAHRRGPKLIVYKMRPKKKTRRKNGHRQELTRVMVESISIGGKALA